MTDNKHQNIIKELKEISVAIDSWDDIFSDFDPRPIPQRTFSEDLIAELKRRYKETKRGSLLIIFYANKLLKDEKTEKVVIERLKQYFTMKALKANRQIKKIRRKGFIFLVCGIISLGTLVFLTYFKIFSALAIELLGIILMPLGWFGIWEGFSKVLDSSPILSNEGNLYSKLSKASYAFKHF